MATYHESEKSKESKKTKKGIKCRISPRAETKESCLYAFDEDQKEKEKKKRKARLTRDKSGPTRGTLTERGWKSGGKKRGSSVSMAIFRIGDLRNNNDPCARWWRSRLWVQGDDSSEKDGPLCRLTRGERRWCGG